MRFCNNALLCNGTWPPFYTCRRFLRKLGFAKNEVLEKNTFLKEPNNLNVEKKHLLSLAPFGSTKYQHVKQTARKYWHWQNWKLKTGSCLETLLDRFQLKTEQMNCRVSRFSFMVRSCIFVKKSKQLQNLSFS